MTDALNQWKYMDRLRDASPEMLEIIKEQHQAIDILFAMLIRNTEGFFPSQSGKPWEAIVRSNELIKRLT